MHDRWKPEALIFDMDGLLVDSEPLWHVVEKQFAAARGETWTDAMALECTGQGLAKTVSHMGERLGIPVDVERGVSELLDRFMAAGDELSLKPGSEALLREARGKVRLALASSSPRRLIDRNVERFGLGEYFEVVVSGEEVARTKPAPDVFLRAAELLGVAPAACVVLEDSLNGSKAGRAAGMVVIAVPEGDWAGRGFEAFADAVVGDLFEARARLTLG